MLYVVPFVAKVMEGCAKSRVKIFSTAKPQAICSNFHFVGNTVNVNFISALQNYSSISLDFF
jgi:hypothetical protein